MAAFPAIKKKIKNNMEEFFLLIVVSTYSGIFAALLLLFLVERRSFVVVSCTSIAYIFHAWVLIMIILAAVRSASPEQRETIVMYSTIGYCGSFGIVLIVGMIVHAMRTQRSIAGGKEEASQNKKKAE